MKQVLKWIGIIILGLTVLLMLGGGILYAISSSRLNSGPDVVVKPAAGEGDIARGEHLAVAISGCASCHGEDLSGKVAVDEPPIGTIYATNLTAGEGGIGATYTDQDWARAIRHGIGADGRALGGMPSNAFAYLSDDDLAAIVAYIKSAPPVDNILPERQFSLPGTVIFGMMAYNTLPTSLIDHASVGGEAPAPGVTADYGEYLTLIGGCRDCHGPDLGGIDPENAPPGPPPGPNLRPDGRLASWTEEDFVTALRSGRTPDGRQLSPEMPWEHYGLMTDEELEAIWLYLHGLGTTTAQK